MIARLGTDLGHGVLHDLFVRQIALVTDEQLVDSLDSISVDLLQPLLDVGESVYRRTRQADSA